MTAALRLFVRGEIRAANLILTGYSLFRRSREAVEEPTRPGISEASPVQRFDHLCDLQSAGNSPRPQVNVVSHALR